MTLLNELQDILKPKPRETSRSSDSGKFNYYANLELQPLVLIEFESLFKPRPQWDFKPFNILEFGEVNEKKRNWINYQIKKNPNVHFEVTTSRFSLWTVQLDSTLTLINAIETWLKDHGFSPLLGVHPDCLPMHSLYISDDPAYSLDAARFMESLNSKEIPKCLTEFGHTNQTKQSESEH